MDLWHGMACPLQANIAAKRNERVTKYRQLTCELRERRPGYNITIVPVVIGALGGSIKEMLRDMERVFSEHSEPERLAEITAAKMQKTILMDVESIIRKVLSGLVQHED